MGSIDIKLGKNGINMDKVFRNPNKPRLYKDIPTEFSLFYSKTAYRATEYSYLVFSRSHYINLQIINNL